MRILVVGAGAIGGYFGGRLLQAGREVTFLVRPRRAAQLAETGLVIKSRFGDAELRSPPTVLAQDLAGREPFDLIVVSCKAYDLEGAIESFAPAVARDGAVLPLLNGMRHLDLLDARFGSDRVLGGQCVIGATLDEAGRIVHLNDTHALTFGERRGNTRSPRVVAVEKAFQGAAFDPRASDDILLEMWEKWVFLATAASINCLMRATVGDVVTANGDALPLELLEGCRSIAQAEGFAPRPAFLDRMRPMLTAPGSPVAASMLRDIERGGPTEGEHVLGDLLARAKGEPPRLLAIALAHLRSYEARRQRTARPS